MNKKNNQIGFTLVTTVLILLILTVASLGTNKLLQYRNDQNKEFFVKSVMTNIANRSMDKAAMDIEKNTYQSSQYSDVILSKDSYGNPSIVWANVPIDRTDAGIQIQYFIERQCTSSVITNMSMEQDCFVSNKASSGSRKIGGIVYKFYNGVYYKIITRIKDTKTNVVAYNQMLVIN